MTAVAPLGVEEVTALVKLKIAVVTTRAQAAILDRSARVLPLESLFDERPFLVGFSWESVRRIPRLSVIEVRPSSDRHQKCGDQVPPEAERPYPECLAGVDSTRVSRNEIPRSPLDELCAYQIVSCPVSALPVKEATCTTSRNSIVTGAARSIASCAVAVRSLLSGADTRGQVTFARAVSDGKQDIRWV